MNKAISETKIRSVVRQELRSFLIGEGLWSTGLNVLKTAAGFNGKKAPPDPNNPSAWQAFKRGAQRIKDGEITQAHYDAFVGRPAAPPAPPAPSPEFKELDGMFKAIKIDTAPFSQEYSELTRKEKDSFVYANADLSPHITNIDELIRILNARFAIEDDEQARIDSTPFDSPILQTSPSATLAKITERLKELLRYYGVNYNKAEGAAKAPEAPAKLIGVALGWFIAMKLVNNLINPMLKEEDITPVQRENSINILNKIKVDFTNIKSEPEPPPAAPAPAAPATPAPAAAPAA